MTAPSCRRKRTAGAVLGALAVAAAALVPACSNDARGIDACRAIESARCEAAPACEGDDPSFGIATEEQVANCKTFYNDHCLVGIENAGGEDPSENAKDNCVDTIAAIHVCQTEGTDLAECMVDLGGDEGPVPVELVEDAEISSNCEAIERPEQLAECKFVEETGEDDD